MGFTFHLVNDQHLAAPGFGQRDAFGVAIPGAESYIHHTRFNQALSSISFKGTPFHLALLIRFPPTGLLMHEAHSG